MGAGRNKNVFALTIRCISESMGCFKLNWVDLQKCLKTTKVNRNKHYFIVIRIACIKCDMVRLKKL